jgi:N-acyl-D-amino-acid deacylase
MYDLIVRKGTVIDGTGASAFRTDVAVRGGSIAAVGQLDGCQASRVIDAEGRLVVPGFIDSHSHADCMVAQCPDLESLTVQGVTTICTGHCGIGIAPVHDYYMSTFNDEDAVARVIPHLFAGMRPGHVPAVDARPFKEAYKEVYGVDFDWSTWGKYLAHIERTGVGVNMVPLVGHGQLRHQTMGTDYRRQRPEFRFRLRPGYLRRDS